MVDNIILEAETKAFLSYIKDEFNEDRVLQSLENLMASIPKKRRSSYGIVSVITRFCKSIDQSACGDILNKGCILYSDGQDFRTISLGLGLISHAGVNSPHKVLPILKEASDHRLWEVKEFVQMFIRKITKVHKPLVQTFLLEMAKSDNPNYRRFASEALRPVVENKWIHDTPEYSLKVLRCLFTEKHDFPKVSVANNLSDLSRKNPDLILEIVRELKALKNENSDFIAYRACRNLIKSNPLQVMDLLEVDNYKYKNQIYFRNDYI